MVGITGLTSLCPAASSLLGLFSPPQHTPVCLSSLSNQLSRWFKLISSQSFKIKMPPLGWHFYFNGRSDWTRTSDLYVPNVAFYQAELHSVILTCLCLSQKINLTSLFYINKLQKIIFFNKKTKKILIPSVFSIKNNYIKKIKNN